MKALAVTLLALLLANGVTPEAAGAQEGACEMGSQRMNCGGFAPGGQAESGGATAGPATGGSAGGGGKKGGGGWPSYWKVERYELRGAGIDGLVECTGPNGQPGIRVRESVRDMRNGQVVSSRTYCDTARTPRDATTLTPPPPPPPEPEEVWAEIPIPPVSFSVNPNAEGLTGLETRLWAEPSGEIALDLPPIRGYEVSARAHVVEYRWKLGNDEVVETTTPGTETAPAVEYVYETKGDYVLTLEIVWGGSFTAGGSDPIDMGTTSQESDRPYRVSEVRSALVGG